MNKTQKSGEPTGTVSPQSITAEEFDAKFDAGEDISEYVDWESGAAIVPGEPTPGQKESTRILPKAGRSQASNEVKAYALPRAKIDVANAGATRSRQEGKFTKESGLDHRHRDKTPPKTGQIEQKRGDAISKNLPQPIKGFSPGAKLGGVRKATDKASVEKVRKAAKNRAP